MFNNREVKEVLPAAARGLKLTLQPWEVRNADGFEKVFAGLRKERPDGLYVPVNPLFNANEKRIVGFTLKSRLPSAAAERSCGGRRPHGLRAKPEEIHRRVAVYVDRILKGTKPADLPVEQPMTYELMINLKTAQPLGLTIPQSVLYRADKVIK